MTRVRILREAPSPRLREVLGDYALLGERSSFREEAREAIDRDASCRRWFERVQLQRRLTKQTLEERRSSPHSVIPDDLRSIDAWLDRHLGRLDREAVARALSDYAVEILNFDPQFSASVKPEGGARTLLGASEARRRLIDSLNFSRGPVCELDPGLLREDYEALSDRGARFARARALLHRCHQIHEQEYLPATGNEALVDWFEDRLDRAWSGFERLVVSAKDSTTSASGCSNLSIIQFDRGEVIDALRWSDRAIQRNPMNVRARINSCVWHFHTGEVRRSKQEARFLVSSPGILKLLRSSISLDRMHHEAKRSAEILDLPRRERSVPLWLLSAWAESQEEVSR